MKVRTTNRRLIGFAYKPGDAEQAELVVAGQSAEKAADHQYFDITPEGVELPERVGAYALNLYSTQMEVMVGPNGFDATEALAAGLPITANGPAGGGGSGVEISGEETPPDVPFAICGSCAETFTAKTDAAAKGKLTRHTKKEHGA